MPHKHTRRERDLSDFDLPPSQIARPLPVIKATRPQKTSTSTNRGSKSRAAAAAAREKDADAGQDAEDVKEPRDTRETKETRDTKDARGTKRKRGVSRSDASKADDAPRAFKRLMALTSGKKMRSGLDDGEPKGKKGKKGGKDDKTKNTDKAKNTKNAKNTKKQDQEKEGDATPTTTAAVPAPAAPSPPTAVLPAASALPTIRPGERLSDFAARVDAALPLGGLIGKSGKSVQDPLGLAKTYRTKKERKMHKLYAEWREEESRIKEREADEQELAEEREMELDEAFGVKWRLDLRAAGSGGSKKKNKKKGGSGGGGSENTVYDGDDMWAELNRKRATAARRAGKVVRAGIHDVVDAPPELTKINSNKYFKDKKTAAAAAAATAKRNAEALASVAAGTLPRSVAASERQELLAARQDVLATYRKRAEERRHQRAMAAE